MSELDLDELLAQMRDIQLQIDTLPDDDLLGLRELRERQRKLQARGRELYNASRTPDQIQKELDDANRVRNEIYERRLSTVDTGPAGGAGGGGIDIRDVHRWNEAIDQTWGLPEVEERIRELEAELRKKSSS